MSGDGSSELKERVVKVKKVKREGGKPRIQTAYSPIASTRFPQEKKKSTWRFDQIGRLCLDWTNVDHNRPMKSPREKELPGIAASDHSRKIPG